MSSKPKSIEQELLSGVGVETLPQGKIVYGIGEKQSGTGIINHNRFLLLNCGTGVVGYSNDFPTALPIASLDKLKPLKKTIAIKDASFFTPKNKLNTVEITSSNVMTKGKQSKETWVFVFKNSKIAEEWNRELRYAKEFPMDQSVLQKPEQKPVNEGGLQEEKPKPKEEQPAQPPKDNNNNLNKPAAENANPVQANKPSNQQGLKPNQGNKFQEGVQLNKKPLNQPQQPQPQTNPRLSNPQLAPSNNTTNSQAGNSRNIQPDSTAPKNPVASTVVKQPEANSYLGSDLPNKNNPTQPVTRPDSNKSKPPQNQFDKPQEQPFRNNDDYLRKPSGSKIEPQTLNPVANQSSFKFKKPTDLNDQAIHDPLAPVARQVQPNESRKNIANDGGPRKQEYLPMEPVRKSGIDPAIRRQSNPEDPNLKPYSRLEQRKPLNQPAQVKKAVHHDWNTEFYEGKNSQIETMIQFRSRAMELSRLIIDELAYPQSSRNYSPALSWQGGESYRIENIDFKLGFVVQSKTANGSSYDQHAVKAIRNEFRNYTYLVRFIPTNEVLRVPLCVLIQYKGITCLAKAVVNMFQPIQMASVQAELATLQNSSNIRKQLFQTTNYASLKYIESSDKIYVDDLVGFLPIDLDSPAQNNQFRPEFLISYGTPLSGEALPYDRKLDRRTQKLVSDIQAASNQVKVSIERLLSSLETLGCSFLSSEDLKSQMHAQGVTTHYLPLLYKSTNTAFLKQVFFSQMCAKVFKRLLNKQLYKQIALSHARNVKPRSQDLSKVLMDTAYDMLNAAVSRNEKTDPLWNSLLQEVKRKYQVVSSREQIRLGYFLSSVLNKSGLKLNYDFFDKQAPFFRGQSSLSYDFVEGFQMKATPIFTVQNRVVSQTVKILEQDPTERGFQSLAEILHLHQSTVPDWIRTNKRMHEGLAIYLANFVAANFDRQQQPGPSFQHLALYDLMNNQPPNLNSIKLYLMAIKWAIKSQKQKLALELYQNATELVTFWGGEFHPLLSEFDDFFSLYYLSLGDYEEAINVAKYSLTNISKILGPNNLSTAQKYYQLGNIYFKVGRKEQAFKEYSKTRDILAANRKTTSPEYALILQKLSLLNLSYGRVEECIDLVLVCLQIYQQDNSQEQGMIDCFELLSRAYEVTQNEAELFGVSSLVAQRLNSTDQPKIMERMLKVCLHPYLSTLSPASKKRLVSIVQKLSLSRNNPSATYSQSFNHLRRRAQREVVGEVMTNYLKKVDRLSTEIVNKELLKRHKGLDMETGSQPQDFLVLLEAVVYMIDQSYMMGVLKDDLY